MTPDNDQIPGIVTICTTGEREVLLDVAFKYALNALAQGWWPRSRLILWGPAAKLGTKDIEIQERLAEMAEHGVELFACKWHADKDGLSDELEGQDVDVKYVGADVTKYLKEGWKVLTF